MTTARLSAALCLALAAPAPAAGPEKVLSAEGVTEYRLPNGLRVLLAPDDSTPKVTVNLTVMVGSRHEGYGETGMAHLLEHMLFKGTPTHRDVPKALRDHGADFNGTTSYDRTNYYETMRASDENLEFAVRLEADRMVNSFVRREDLASEMTVVRNEFEAGENSPTAVLSQRVWATAYEWHNYGKNTIGNRTDIERVPVDSLRDFYKKYYRPDNALLIVAGNFDEAKALALAAKYFGPLKRPDTPLPDTYTEEPAQDGQRAVTLRRVGTIATAGAAYHVPAGSHADFAAVEVLAQVLAAEPTGRLYQALVVAKKATGVSAGAQPLYDPGLLEASVQVADGEKPDAVRDLMLAELDRAAADPPTAEEVERARRKLLKERELLAADIHAVASELSDWASVGDWRLFYLHRDRLAKVTADDVARVAKKYLTPTNRTVGLFVPTEKPERATVPARPQIAKVLEDYKPGEAVAKGEQFDPTPANVEKRLVRPAAGGVKVAVLPRKTRGNTVNLDLTLRYGNAESLKGYETACDLLPDLLERGTRSMTRAQIEDELDKLKASVSVSGGLGRLKVRVECKRETLPGVMKLLKSVLREPSFPADEFDLVKKETRDGLKGMETEPEALAFFELARRLEPYPPTDVRYTPTLAESIARVEAATLDKVKTLYAEQLSGAHGEFVAVGDCDAGEAAKMIADVLAGWTSGVKYERVARPAVAAKPETVAIRTPDKENAVYAAGYKFPMTDADPDYPALAAANFLLGEAPLASRLSNRVRGKEGLSYGVGSSLAASPLDKNAGLTVYAITNPANIEKTAAAIREEIERFSKDGVTAAEVAEGKKAYLESLKVSRANDATLAALIANEMAAGRSFGDYYGRFEAAVAGLTAEAVNSAARELIDAGKLTVIKAGDFGKK